jgi:hypothetical protein
LYITKFAALEDRAVDVRGVLEGIRLTFEDNDALRTRYVLCEGQWRQEIMGSGEIIVTEVSSPSPRPDLDEVATLLGRLSPEPGEIPVRAAMVTFEGRPVYVYLAVHHASVDNMGAGIACEELRRRILGLATLTASSWQPHDIAEFEASPAGRALAERSDRYHRVKIRELADFDAPPADRTTTAMREYQLRSPAVVVAAQQISRSLNVSAFTVTLAAYCLALSARLSMDRFPLALTSGNRFRPKLRMSIAKLAQSTSISVDLTSSTFEDFCRQTNNATLLAYRHAVYDPELRTELFREARAERGKDVFFPYLANFHMTTVLEDLDPESQRNRQRQVEANLDVRPDELRKLLLQGVSGATPSDEIRFSDLSLDIYEFSEQADMRLTTDLAFFSDTVLRSLLLTTERLLVEVACGNGKADMRNLLDLCPTS